MPQNTFTTRLTNISHSGMLAPEQLHQGDFLLVTHVIDGFLKFCGALTNGLLFGTFGFLLRDRPSLLTSVAHGTNTFEELFGRALVDWLYEVTDLHV